MGGRVNQNFCARNENKWWAFWSTHLEMVPIPGCGSGLLPMWLPTPNVPAPLPPWPWPLTFPFPLPLPLPLLLKKSSITRRGWRFEGVRVKAGGDRPAESASFSVCLSGRLLGVVRWVRGVGRHAVVVLGNIKVGIKASKNINNQNGKMWKTKKKNESTDHRRR